MEFTHTEAITLWSRLVAGWAKHLNEDGSRTLIDGVTNVADQGGSYEGVTRMLPGLAGWLSSADRPAVVTWRGETFDIEALTRQALTNGCNPTSRHYWGRERYDQNGDQRTVETAPVAFAAWLSRERVWSQMDAITRQNFVTFCDTYGQRPAQWRNNWSLFWTTNHACRRALGAAHDPAIIDETLDFIDGLYCGDGWYDDSMQRNHFDDYNWWVFATYHAAWILCDGHNRPEHRDKLLHRLHLAMQHYPYFFAPDGAYTEFGRSLSYKFSRLNAPLWAYRLGVWPYSPGMLRRLVGRHLRWYVDRGALRADGTLSQALTGWGSLSVRETYISTGATYWAIQAFAALWSIPDNDEFWTAPEEPLPSEQTDYVKVFPQPGWVVSGDPTSGTVQRFSAFSTHDLPDYFAKYSKFVYSTTAPFNAGMVNGVPAPDNMLCLTDGQRYAHRGITQAGAVGEPGWLRMRYTQTIGGGEHTIDTTIIVHGTAHIRAHRIRLSDNTVQPIGAVEGSAALGFLPGETPQVHSDPASGLEIASVSRFRAPDRVVGIAGLRGYDGQQPATNWQGRHDLNSVYPDYILPLLTVSALQPVHTLICVGYTGGAVAEAVDQMTGLVEEANWESDGTFHLTWRDGTSVTVPPLDE